MDEQSSLHRKNTEEKIFSEKLNNVKCWVLWILWHVYLNFFSAPFRLLLNPDFLISFLKKIFG